MRPEILLINLSMPEALLKHLSLSLIKITKDL